MSTSMREKLQILPIKQLDKGDEKAVIIIIIIVIAVSNSNSDGSGSGERSKD